MSARGLFLAAYVSSGMAGLIYQVTWTRMFGLHLGHSLAAASAVLAAFMGGLCGGALAGGRLALHLSPPQALKIYALLEGVAAASALALPFALDAIAPRLDIFYGDGSGSLAFQFARLGLCIGVLLVPSLALGATFPIAVRWFGRSSTLYAANTVGAAIGALATGFVLLPLLGHLRSIAAGVVATTASAVVALALTGRPTDAATTPQRRAPKKPPPQRDLDVRWIGLAMLALTGFATFLFEISWMRLFAMIVGPSTYAFSATVAAFIVALAIGSVLGTWVAARAKVAPALALALVAAAAGVVLGASYAGTTLPHHIAGEFTQVPLPFASVLARQIALISSIVLPGAIALGAAFPLALEMFAGQGTDSGRRAGAAYGVNALASVLGALAAGFVTIPLSGIRSTLQLGAAVLLAGAALVAIQAALPKRHRLALVAAAAAGAVVILLSTSTPWDRELLARGAYNAPAVNAGTLLYYREGAAGTVSVTRLNGELSLAIDGKVDASTSEDMLTQKMLAHLPLLLHGRPRTVGIIGLGSGVTLGSALTHAVESVDVIELSPQVVEASHYFASVNRRALADPRAHLVVGDGRTHLLLSSRAYDVIISEPSNPWMAGIASLFTREFFQAAHSRLTDGGILCQWAHTYNMSEADLRSIAATFASVFPNGTMWLVGSGDLLFIGKKGDGGLNLSALDRAMLVPAVAADLAQVSVHDPFALFSMFVGGPDVLEVFGANAVIQTDDRMPLEFSAPAAMFARVGTGNAAILRQLRQSRPLPAPVTAAAQSAGAPQWRNRARMMTAAGAHDAAYSDFAEAIALDADDGPSLIGLVDAALVTNREDAARLVLEQAARRASRSPRPWIALSRLFAASGKTGDALAAAVAAGRIAPDAAECLEQLASVYTGAGDAQMLPIVAERLRRVFPARPSGHYYAAAAEYMLDRLEPALALARDAIRLDAGYADAHNLEGAILARLGQAPAARQAFDTALRLNPRDSSAYRNFGLLELSSGNRKAAARHFAEALALDPASEASRQGLEQSLAY